LTLGSYATKLRSLPDEIEAGLQVDERSAFGGSNMFESPPGLARLIADGIWPTANGPSMAAQQLRPIISAERVRRFAADESLICLQSPPFHTLAQEQAAGGAGDFWERFGALDQIDPAQLVIIGDFGIGSDTAIVLDYARDAANPPVLRLQWAERGVGNRWVQGARDFDEFAAMLGLGQGDAEASAGADGRIEK
jgi:hypothetical protein